MYREHFKLARMPFDNTPDPHFFYMTAAHEEALAALAYGVNQERGATVVTGAPGCGKTLLGQMLVRSIQLRADTATLNYTPESPHDLLTGFCRELGLRYRSDYSTGELVDRLRQNLLSRRAEGRCVVLLVDEAQNLSLALLEHLRMLGNLELDTAKLVQIVLLGQPELIQRLHDPRLEQLRQRIYCWRALEPLGREDVAGYVEHRLRAAGAADTGLFTDESIALIHERSGGIPRLINQLADNSLLVAYSANRPVVDRLTVGEAVQQMLSVSPLPVGLPTAVLGEAAPAPSKTLKTEKASDPGAVVANWAGPVQAASELAGRLIELVRAGNQQIAEAAQAREALLDTQRDAASQLERLDSSGVQIGKELAESHRAARRQMARARRASRILRARIEAAESAAEQRRSAGEPAGQAPEPATGSDSGPAAASTAVAVLASHLQSASEVAGRLMELSRSGAQQLADAVDRQKQLDSAIQRAAQSQDETTRARAETQSAIDTVEAAARAAAEVRQALQTAEKSALGQMQQCEAARQTAMKRSARLAARARREAESLERQLSVTQVLAARLAEEAAAAPAIIRRLEELAAGAEAAGKLRDDLEGRANEVRVLLGQASTVESRQASLQGAVAAATRAGEGLLAVFEQSRAREQGLNELLREADQVQQAGAAAGAAAEQARVAQRQLEAFLPVAEQAARAAVEAVERATRTAHASQQASTEDLQRLLAELLETVEGRDGLQATLQCASKASGALETSVAQARAEAADLARLVQRGAQVRTDAADLRAAAQAAAEARQEIGDIVGITEKAATDVRLAFSEYNILRAETSTVAAALGSRLEELVVTLREAAQARNALAREMDRSADAAGNLKADTVAGAAQAGQLATYLAEAARVEAALRQLLGESARRQQEIEAAAARDAERWSVALAEAQAVRVAVGESVGSAQLLQAELAATMDGSAERIRDLKQEGESHAVRARRAADTLAQTMQAADTVRSDVDASVERGRAERAASAMAAEQVTRQMAALAARLEAGEALLTELAERSRSLDEREQAGMSLLAEAERRLQSTLAVEARLVQLTERFERERQLGEECAARICRERAAQERSRDKCAQKLAKAVSQAESVIQALRQEADEARQTTLDTALEKSEASASSRLLDGLVDEVNALCAEFEARPSAKRATATDSARDPARR